MPSESTRRQIIALGGGGFSEEPHNLALDLYSLQQTGKAVPRVLFLPTASGDSIGYTDRFYEAFSQFSCRPGHLSLHDPPTKDLASLVAEQDLIYVGGGSTPNLLTAWRQSGLEAPLRAAYQRGVVFTGVSAGGICWFEQGLSDSVVVETMSVIECLGWLPGSFCPHYDAEAMRKPAFRHLISAGELVPGYAADDGVGVHFVNERFLRAIKSRAGCAAYWVERRPGSGFREHPLETHWASPGGAGTDVWARSKMSS